MQPARQAERHGVERTAEHDERRGHDHQQLVLDHVRPEQLIQRRERRQREHGHAGREAGDMSLRDAPAPAHATRVEQSRAGKERERQDMHAGTRNCASHWSSTTSENKAPVFPPPVVRPQLDHELRRAERGKRAIGEKAHGAERD